MSCAHTCVLCNILCTIMRWSDGGVAQPNEGLMVTILDLPPHSSPSPSSDGCAAQAACGGDGPGRCVLPRS